MQKSPSKSPRGAGHCCLYVWPHRVCVQEGKVCRLCRNWKCSQATERLDLSNKYYGRILHLSSEDCIRKHTSWTRPIWVAVRLDPRWKSPEKQAETMQPRPEMLLNNYMLQYAQWICYYQKSLSWSRLMRSLQCHRTSLAISTRLRNLENKLKEGV